MYSVINYLKLNTTTLFKITDLQWVILSVQKRIQLLMVNNGRKINNKKYILIKDNAIKYISRFI